MPERKLKPRGSNEGKSGPKGATERVPPMARQRRRAGGGDTGGRAPHGEVVGDGGGLFPRNQPRRE